MQKRCPAFHSFKTATGVAHLRIVVFGGFYETSAVLLFTYPVLQIQTYLVSC